MGSSILYFCNAIPLVTSMPFFQKTPKCSRIQYTTIKLYLKFILKCSDTVTLQLSYAMSGDLNARKKYFKVTS